MRNQRQNNKNAVQSFHFDLLLYFETESYKKHNCYLYLFYFDLLHTLPFHRELQTMPRRNSNFPSIPLVATIDIGTTQQELFCFRKKGKKLLNIK